jgi:hypothetical protein
MTESGELGLFAVDEMEKAFKDAGLAVDDDPADTFGRGLYAGGK